MLDLIMVLSFWMQFAAFLLVALMALKHHREIAFHLCGIGCFAAAMAAVEAYQGTFAPPPAVAVVTFIHGLVAALVISSLDALEAGMRSANKAQSVEWSWLGIWHRMRDLVRGKETTA